VALLLLHDPAAGVGTPVVELLKHVLVAELQARKRSHGDVADSVEHPAVGRGMALELPNDGWSYGLSQE
jgi:hypothetical protein